jgi:hypothetical protein
MSVSVNSPQKLPIFASALNAESRMKFLGAWRPILRNLFEHKRKCLELTQEAYFKNIIKGNLDLLELFLDIFGLDDSIKTNICEDLNVPPQAELLSQSSPIQFLLR